MGRKAHITSNAADAADKARISACANLRSDKPTSEQPQQVRNWLDALKSTGYATRTPGGGWCLTELGMAEALKKGRS